METGHMQKISTGKLDPTLTNVAISTAPGISYMELSAYYDEVTEEDLKVLKKKLERQKAVRGKKKGDRL